LTVESAELIAVCECVDEFEHLGDGVHALATCHAKLGVLSREELEVTDLVLAFLGQVVLVVCQLDLLLHLLELVGHIRVRRHNQQPN